MGTGWTRIGAASLVALIAGSACGTEGPVAPQDVPWEEAAGPTGLATRAALADPPFVPFKGSTRGQLVEMTPAPQSRCPAELPLLAVYRGEGTATHMGRITVEGSECLFFDPSDPSSAASGEGRMTLTAARGDELRIGYDRTHIWFEEPPSSWLRWSAEIEAEGGTGRFEHAELSEVTWYGGVDLATMDTWSVLQGRIRMR